MFALIPAAGRSSRMGRPKLSLPLGETTVLEAVVAVLKEAGASEVLVVIAPHVAELAALALRAGAHVLELPKATPDMRATVEFGLAWLEDRYHPEPNGAWLLAPADHPALEAAAVRQLIDAYRRQLLRSLAAPTFAGQRGHPAILAWKHVEGIRQLPPDVGLNFYLRQHAAEMLEVPVDSESVLFDLDTPNDYARLTRHCKPG